MSHKNLYTISIFSSILAMMLFSSCSENQNTNSIESEVIDFNKLDKRSLSELQTDTAFLLLKASNPDLLVGSISKIVKSNDSFYFIDGRYRYAVAYDSMGRSIRKIGDIGKGHLEYLRCHDLATDNQGNVYLSDGTSDKYINYDPNFNAIEEYQANPEGTDIFITEDGHVLVGISPWYLGDEGNHTVALLDPQFNLIETYGDKGTYDIEVAFGGTGFANSGQYISYVPSCEIRDEVMLFSPKDGKLVKKLIFDFGDKSVPDKLKSDLEGNMEQIRKCTRLQDVFSVTDDRVVGRISMGREIKPFVIDLKNQIIYLGDEVELREECIAFIDNSFINLRQIVQEHYPDSVKTHIENNQSVLEFNKIH